MQRQTQSLPRVELAGFNLSGGNGYDSANPPSVTISSATGAGATAFATVNATGEVSGITMVNPGAGYVTATVVIAEPRIGARYYTPLPDDGFLDIGEKVHTEYEVLLPKNYAGIYYVGAQANSAQEITESDSPSISNSTTGNSTTGNATSNSTTGNSTLSPIVTNNVFMSNIAARIHLLSGPQESTGMLTATFSANGSLLRWPRFLDHWLVKISDGCRGFVGRYRGIAFRSISFWDWSPIFVSVA